MSKGQTTMATGITGVSMTLPNRRYKAQIDYKQLKKSKVFDTLEEAIAQRKEWELIVNPPVDTSKLCTDNCRNCKYMKWLDSYQNVPYCDYYLMTEQRRPCKAGDGCTVKLPRTKDHNERYRKHYADSFYHTEEYKWRKARVDSELNIIRK